MSRGRRGGGSGWANGPSLHNGPNLHGLETTLNVCLFVWAGHLVRHRRLDTGPGTGSAEGPAGQGRRPGSVAWPVAGVGSSRLWPQDTLCSPCRACPSSQPGPCKRDVCSRASAGSGVPTHRGQSRLQTAPRAPPTADPAHCTAGHSRGRHVPPVRGLAVLACAVPGHRLLALRVPAEA